MKLNRKKLNVVLPQIKAHLNVAVMQDNSEYPGLIDFLFQPKSDKTEFGYINRLTCSMGGEDDLFGATVVETLGKSILIDIARLRDALNSSESEPELKDGKVNGISILASNDGFKAASMGKIIEDGWDSVKDFNFHGVKFIMPRIDYELMAGTVSRFVSQDTSRMFMCGYDVDFGKGDDFINFAATDGRRLAICRFPHKHPKLEDAKGQGGDFIFNPINLFIPKSDYSKVQWLVNEYASVIRIQTADYSIDCWAKAIEAQFPNYLRVIPSEEANREWMRLNARSARKAFDSIKGLIINNGGYSSVKDQVVFNAEDSKRIKLTIPGASVDIDGEASRPMRLRVGWDYMDAAFFDTPYTKFMLGNVDKAVLTEESRAIRGTVLTITKVVMPMQHEDNTDEWGILNTPNEKTEIVQNTQSDEDDAEVSYGDESAERGFEEEDAFDKNNGG